MKRMYVIPAMMAGALFLTSCGTVGSNALSSIGTALVNNALSGNNNSNGTTVENNGGESLLGSLLGEVLGASTGVSESNILGTWQYIGSDCTFESENLLAQAGGAIAANKIENQINEQLAKVGIKQGACSFTFNKDKTYSAVIGGRTMQGTYELDSKNKTLKLTYLAGLASTTGHVAMKGGKLSLLFEGSKLLNLMKGISALSGNSSIKTMSSLLSNYNGMYIGMQLSK